MKIRSTLTALTATFGFLCTPISAAAQVADAQLARITDFAFTEAPDDHVLGDENAAITLIVWASVTCPHCSAWFTKEWPTVKTELVDTGKLRFVFREFPTAPGELSMTGFRLAECAPREDFMSIIEFQMEEQKNIREAAKNGKSAEAYGVIAGMAGMESDEAISSCLRNPDITAHILDNSERATLAGVKGVPGFLINGETYKGRQDAKSLVALINEMDEKGISSLPKDQKAAKPHTGHDPE